MLSFTKFQNFLTSLICATGVKQLNLQPKLNKVYLSKQCYTN